MTTEEFVISLDRASLVETGFSNRRQTEADFVTICRKEGIEVSFGDFATSFRILFHERTFIVLPISFTGNQLLFAMFHELGHHFLEHQMIHELDPAYQRQEQDADTFAGIALMP